MNGFEAMNIDEPVDIAQCACEAEEREVGRTQEVCAQYLADHDDTYRQCSVKADKSGQGIPSLTTLRLYG